MQSVDSQKVILDKEGICQFLPHRAPLLLLDDVVAFESGVYLEARKFVGPEEPVLVGHFPGNPIWPGVYLVEGMAQASGVLEFLTQKSLDPKNKTLLTGVEQARFRKPVMPGSTILYRVQRDRMRGNFYWFSGTARVNGEVVAEAKFSAMMQAAVTQEA